MEPLINKLYDSKSFLKCSHRGGLGLYPENTLYAFSCSVKKNNIDMIELDLQFTRDQKVVVLHDDTIDRTTNGKGAISNLNYNEVLIYDAGYNFYDNEEGYIYRGKGIRVPLFEDVLREFPNTYLNIELKQNLPNFLTEVLSLIKKYNFEKYIIIGSSNFMLNKNIMRLLPHSCHYPSRIDLYILLLIYPFCFIPKYSSKFSVIEAPINYFGISIHMVFNRIAKKINKPIIFWGANNPKSIKIISNVSKVKGIITDFPNSFKEE